MANEIKCIFLLYIGIHILYIGIHIYIYICVYVLTLKTEEYIIFLILFFSL